MRNYFVRHRQALKAGAAMLVLFFSLGGCGLESVDIPELDGPSTYGTGIRVTATPDLISADGFSTALVTANVFDQNGRPAAGRDIFFAITNATGLTADIGKLRSTGPDLNVGTGFVVRTDGNGTGRVVYVAPPRTDFTNNGSVLVTVRPVGEDAAGENLHSVRIELRSAEPRFFPNPGTGLSCNFVVEAPGGFCTGVNAGTSCNVRVNSTVIFQQRSFGDIIRYQWFFGDGRPAEYGPDQVHIFRSVGTFTVTLLIVDGGGFGAACSATMNVIP